LSEESVYVKPVPVALASPETLSDLKRVYDIKREAIRKRLHELSTGWKKSDAGVFAEFCYCILLAGRRAEDTLPLAAEMEKNRLLFEGTKEQMEAYLAEHGHAVMDRAQYLLHWREKFHEGGLLIMKKELESNFRTMDGWDIASFRESLASERHGVGWKVSSQFLRNVGIGLGHGLALLDRHVQRELMKFGYIAEAHEQALDRETYLEYERKMQALSKDSDIPMDDLDLLLWSNRTGKIIK
jgi:thermostable 8-oxoguanine DNA glycosylase